ncbi:hypothetical protein SAFG77S_07350 [Streptomyces afghaniensis]
MQLKKDLYRVFSSNFINLLIGIVSGFLIPAFLSLDNYALFKTFTFYLTYVGILHFGLIDGIFIKYGSLYEKSINKSRLIGEHKFLLLFQLLVTLITTILGIILKDKIMIAFSIAILPINMQTLFKMFYQALGEFKVYTKLVLITPNLLMVFNLFIIFVLKIDNYMPFIIANIVTNYIVFIGMEIYFLSKYKGIKAEINISEIWSHFRIGSFVMIGNLANMFFGAADRWFVKFTLTTKDFAFYSFAVSMMAIIKVLINSVSMTFYPHLAKGKKDGNLRQIKILLLIVGCFSSGGYFAFALIVNLFMEKYEPSLEIIAVLFAGFPAIIIINALYINLYKVNKLEKKYVYIVLKMCLLALLLIILTIFLNKSSVLIASATTVAYYIWYFYSAKDFPDLKFNNKELIYLAVYFINYAVSLIYFNSLTGLFVFFITLIIFTLLIYRSDFELIVKGILARGFKR